MEAPTRDYHHPYKPYGIQIELMNAIYGCIAEGKVGVFESPTGTGKSLSLICGSLTWLRDVQDDTSENQDKLEEESGEPTWVIEHAKLQRRESLIERKSELEARLRQIRAKEIGQKHRYETGEPRTKRLKAEGAGSMLRSDDETRFELEEYNSEAEDAKAEPSLTKMDGLGISSASMQLMKRLGLVLEPSSEDEGSSPPDELKIYFCSRTHSQLTQFVQELRRVDLPPPSWAVATDILPSGMASGQVVKHTPLGSRKNLCINPNVSKLGNAPAINERCLEMQQPEVSKDHKCPFIPNQENETLVNVFRDHTLAQIRDIEDLGTLGKRIGICPYYASRSTIKPAEIVTLPYPLLLQRSAREALNMSLRGHVVIIDEAHNLMDTISNIHSISVTLAQLKRCRYQLGIYLQKFRNKLKGKNRVYVAQVVRLIDSVSSYLETVAIGKQPRDGVVEVGTFMAGKGVDQINLNRLMHYLQESKLARKVESYACYTEEQAPKHGTNSDAKRRGSSMPILTHIQSFLQTLTNPAAEGRFFYEKDDGNEVSLKYMLLDPTNHFKEIVEDARAVILAGGTMSPMDDYARHLFAYVNPERLETFSCGHIIPKENLIALQVAKGPGGIDFDFTFEKRNSSAMIDGLGDYLVKLSSVVPDGVVVFFPSYAYLDQVVVRWQGKPINMVENTWDRLLSKKKIFRESKITGVDDMLSQYAQAISAGNGGLLLSVIGGKLSEGINFSDSLGRGVVVVGLPFPNIQSAQWKAKLEYIEKTTIERSGRRDDGKAAARDFYENACMRAVNQSIGRAIRHKDDYASIVLLDKRYVTSRIEGKLPGWIRQGLEKRMGDKGSEDGIERLRSFFRPKRDKA